MDDFVVNVKQVYQYPLQSTAVAGDVALLQKTGVDPTNPAAGPYGSMNILDIVTQARQSGGPIALNPGETISWGTGTLTFGGNGFMFGGSPVTMQALTASSISINGVPVADQNFVNQLINSILDNSVYSFNGRTGIVQLNSDDILRAGGILQVNPVFAGMVIVPTAWDPRTDTDQAASTAFVQDAICWWLMNSPVVQSFNGRWGAVTLTTDDVNQAYANSTPGDWPTAPSPAFGDASTRIATTMFVDETVNDLKDWVQDEIGISIGTAYAPLNSPNFTGVPTAPTANPGSSTGQIATTAFVAAAVTASTTGVASFNTRTGAVVLQQADVTGVGAALLASPTFTGNPQAPTAAPGNSSTSLATTAFVAAAITAAAPPAGVSSFNTRTGAVTLSTTDITGAGGAPLASPAMTGTPSAPTAAPGTNTTQLATTAFVTAAVTAVGAGVTSFNSRTGAVQLIANDLSAVGGALIASPAFTGAPTAPTAAANTNTQQIATTAFVTSAIAALSIGVSSFNSRTGAVSLTAADVTAVGGALLASPSFTGAPQAPTALQTSNDTTIATTAYVRAALAAAPGGVSSFNGRTGAITLQANDVSGVGGALLSSPAFTGSPTAPTPSNTSNNTQIATTAFVMGQLATAGGVNTFNGRAGAVTLNATDIQSASGAVYRQSDTAPSATPNTLWFDSVNGQLYVQYVDPVSSAQSWVVANSMVNPPTPAPAAGTRVLIASHVVAPASPVTNVLFFYNFDNTYDIYEFEIYDVQRSASASLVMQYSSDGSTWDNTANYAWGFSYGTTATSPGWQPAGATGATWFQLDGGVPSTAGFLAEYLIRLMLPWTTDRYKYFRTNLIGTGTVATYYGVGGGVFVGNFLPLKGIAFALSGAGTITRGVFNLYGIVKAGAGGS